MIVPDASVTALLFSDPGVDPRVTEATIVLHADPEWVAPEHWRVEVLSITCGLRFGGKIDQDDAEDAVVWLQDVTVATSVTGPHLPGSGSCAPTSPPMTPRVSQ
ncbi:MAG: hypothetical protein L0H84_12500 [Pseudonocardia sp.]|nr:hypothetical protein [Pseudonocardia sp.]